MHQKNCIKILNTCVSFVTFEKNNKWRLVRRSQLFIKLGTPNVLYRAPKGNG
jgi:hypothetical protein